jgi:hypothetical protein
MILILMQADSSQWSLITEQVQHVPRFLPWVMFWQQLLLTQCFDFDVYLYYEPPRT